MSEEFTFLLHKSYSRESQTDFLESGNGKIIGIPGNREREIPGMKHYYQVGLLTLSQVHVIVLLFRRC
jgi:hypothetical protein